MEAVIFVAEMYLSDNGVGRSILLNISEAEMFEDPLYFISDHAHTVFNSADRHSTACKAPALR